MNDLSTSLEIPDTAIAIVGMAGRFPQAQNLEAFWQNLKSGKESITFFSDEELQTAGVDPATLSDPNFVKARAILDEVEGFDAGLFGLSPREAEITDPQHRLFLESAWEALENAGYDAPRYPGAIGVFAGSSLSSYLLNACLNPQLKNTVDLHQLAIGNDKDFLTTRVAYKLNLKGPSYTVQTACSTSLVAVHLACQSLLNGECDMALAGGVSISAARKMGYFYHEGGIGSIDGHCRAFDAAAKGTVGGEGVGIVVLKRLEDALNDRDRIQAVIRGSAINNDGALKVSYTAPSLDSQAQAIRMAIAIAEIPPESLTYIETHGTGTPLGDPIEIAALTQAFSSSQRGFCAIGSVKTNIGHLDAAAGIAGLIKTVLALQHQQIPPSLHFQQPNPQIDFANSPFYVNTQLSAWEACGTPRRAGVSSFGIGGTNAHVILEEAPPIVPSPPVESGQVLRLSAKTETALETATANFVQHLQQHPDLNLADVAYTLHLGRRPLEYRRAVVCQTVAEAIAAFTHPPASSYCKTGDRSIAFLFPGQGSQYLNMARELYDSEPTVRHWIDRGCEVLQPHLGLDLRSRLYSEIDSLTPTGIAQPALFVVEYALAQLWISWGVVPDVALGHSIGEYVAATLAGVFTFEDALTLVAQRGYWMQQQPPGAMLAVQQQADRLELGENLWLAAYNSPTHCVVSGTFAAIDALQHQLEQAGIGCRRLQTSHAFHSPLMGNAVAPLVELVRTLQLQPPRFPFLSNVTGTWITAAQATDPSYWGEHLINPVQFSQGAAELLKDPDQILIEVGPGRTLSRLSQQQSPSQTILTTLRHPQEQHSDRAFILNTVAQLWLVGVEVNPSEFYATPRSRVPLPTYPFERQRYWLEPHPQFQALVGQNPRNLQHREISDWFYLPSWKRSLLSQSSVASGCVWVLMAESAEGREFIEQLQARGVQAIAITSPHPDYLALLQKGCPTQIIEGWGLSNPSLTHVENLLALVQNLGAANITQPLTLTVLSNQVQEVTGLERGEPETAIALAACNVIPLEYPNITCRSIDIAWPSPEAIAQLVAEVTSNSRDPVVAYRGSHRWLPSYEPVRLTATTPQRLRHQGVYLITGGLGGIGFALAEYLARTVQARLILVGRTAKTAEKVPVLEALGAQVLVVQADITCREQLQPAIALATQRFGPIHGVIHAAGIPGGGTIQRLAPAQLHRTLAPKVTGTRLLAELLQDAPLDFFYCCSSLNSMVGVPGLVDYCAANAFLDAFARTHPAACAINWGRWQVGMMAGSTEGMTVQEGVAAFERILSSPPMAQIIVSPEDFATLQARSRQVTAWQAQLTAQVTAKPAHPRPPLETPYTAPRNAVESEIAQLSQQLLGVEPVGVEDNFFELGGDSLMATMLISRLSKNFNLELSPASFFHAPTVAALGETIVEQLAVRSDRQSLAQALAEIEMLSDDEVQALLATTGGI
ncbi:SDR family NAD(P)-dependent oxidoreductase [Kamptonema cortianum]|uniref:SDR family NAD(P)-dependent oxidoreductase n=1 Tax=Geitlerinema calcuttense NRMC-F 0142 TaxID=2922238 RepID=A0ABT7LZZ3_9CYAN|nr:type I polyketide synthase [Geitlerinema calcuttense]MDK3158299.1 SDR family NAD(P)-dependent oxidoreductase [Kamptonema cortianum]MDL5057563.1 SDR family NAD(P)-dependent oxidoreductase [Geitlerinema calcuttense NRMC-F 0142]